MKKRIYLDYAAATPIRESAKDAVLKGFLQFGNPSGLHKEGICAKDSLEDSRSKVAKFLEVRSTEIIFTSGGTESNNLAILGSARAVSLARDIKKTHWITTKIEHASVLAPFKELERIGAKVQYLSPDENGIINSSALTEALTRETVFVSIGFANGETGVIQPMRTLGKIVRDNEKRHNIKTTFHSDAGQIHLYENALPNSFSIDLMSLGSGKLYGPRGIGALFVKKEISISPIIFGGAQETGLRSGTESVALANGFGVACAELQKIREKEAKRIVILRDYLYSEIKKKFPTIVKNGYSEKNLPHILNISIPLIDTEYLIAFLDARGIAVSSKSACSAKARESHVISSICKNETWRASTSIRFSLGENTKLIDIKYLLKTLQEAVKVSSAMVL